MRLHMFTGSLHEITNDAGPRCAPHRARSLAVANVPMEGSARTYCSSESCVGACMQRACMQPHGPEATKARRPACSSGCGPCPTEADDSSPGGVARSMYSLFRMRVVERCLC